MIHPPKNGPAKPSKLDAIIDEAYKDTLSKGATAQQIFAAGLALATGGLVLVNLSALPDAFHAIGSVMIFVGVMAMVFIRRKL